MYLLNKMLGTVLSKRTYCVTDEIVKNLPFSLVNRSITTKSLK